MQTIEINVGPLRSSSGFYFSIRKGLEEFNNGWQRGLQPSVCWDLRHLTAGRINVGAVAFFLAIAHRVRHFTGRKQTILLEWHPKQFGFLSDVGFFEIANEYDLFSWPFEIGGFDSGTINPNTKVMTFEKIASSPDLYNLDAVSSWKKLHREKYRSKIINKCESLFFSSDTGSKRNLPLVMSRTCAELVTNSLLWGDATSFVSLQRTKKNIIINVCDIGRGFRYSVLNKKDFKKSYGETDKVNDVIAISLGCIMNEDDFGLKRAISTVLELGGDITISSSTGEIHWTYDMWNNFLYDVNNKGTLESINTLLSNNSFFNEKQNNEKNKGYVRFWPSSVRGTRISFYIPLDGEVL